MDPQTTSAPPRAVVLDTNIVLDLWLFADPATPPLFHALQQGALGWIATPPMREELLRVLAYPHIAGRLAYYEKNAEHLLAEFDTRVQWREVAIKAPYHCKDPDDQKFIDLAVAHQAYLVSKDKAVLCMAKRLERLGVQVLKAWPAPSP